jgi:stage V sporulation protein B
LSKQKKQSFLQGAAILAVTAAIIKVMGAIYKIPLGNILGDEGFAYFNVAYSIYAVLISLSSAGLPVALSRMIAASAATGNLNQVKRIFSIGRIAFFTLGMTATLIMALFPEQLAGIMEKPEAAPSIRALAPSVVFVCLMSAYRGYTQGMSDMIPTSVSQIIEVLGKLLFGLLLAWWFVSRGRGLELGSAGAITGVTLGSLMALIYVVVYKRKMDADNPQLKHAKDIPLSRSQTFKRIVRIAIPIAIGSSILSILAMLDTMLTLNRLQNAAGFSSVQASVLYGVYSKIQTLFNFPSSFIVPVTISVIPAISSCIAIGDSRGAIRLTETSLKLTSLLALPAGAGLSVLSWPIVNVLYPGSHSEGPTLMAIMGIASFFVCLTLVTNAIMQAYGHERIPVYTMTMGGIIKIAATWILVAYPEIAVRGTAISTLLCYVVISIVNIAFLIIKLPERPRVTKIFIKPFFATVVMSAAAYLSYSFFTRLMSGVFDPESRGMMALAMAAAIIVAIIIYAALIIALRAITQEDLASVPKGDRIAKLLRIRK